MNVMPKVFAYTIKNLTADIPAALAHFGERYHHAPTAMWLHPDRIPADWPATWPPVFPNDKLNRNIVGMELTATAPDQPAQLRLI